MGILSIHSHVATGHVGNSAAVFALQRLGHEVWPVFTVQLGHHPGHGGWHGHRVDPDDVAAVLAGIRGRGFYADCAAVLTGYLGGIGMAPVALVAWHEVRTANPNTVICCDPIMGDEAEGLYVPDDLAAFYREQALAAADIVTPNRFELEVLSGRPAGDPAGAVLAARALLDRGPELVLATSVPNGAALATLLVTRSGAWRVSAPKVALRAKGAGDFLAACWLSAYLRDGDPLAALQWAASAADTLVRHAAALDAAELPLVECQDDWSAPTKLLTIDVVDV